MSDGEKVYFRRSEIVHDLKDFFVALAEPDHQS